jgi:hypothetical protein
MASIQKAHPTAWLFSGCPADGPCISPPVYAVVGAASALGGVTRMTVSLVSFVRARRVSSDASILRLTLPVRLKVVILFELTGAIDLVLQIMMAGEHPSFSERNTDKRHRNLTAANFCSDDLKIYGRLLLQGRYL